MPLLFCISCSISYPLKIYVSIRRLAQNHQKLSPICTVVVSFLLFSESFSFINWRLSLLAARLSYFMHINLNIYYKFNIINVKSIIFIIFETEIPGFCKYSRQRLLKQKTKIRIAIDRKDRTENQQTWTWSDIIGLQRICSFYCLVEKK